MIHTTVKKKIRIFSSLPLLSIMLSGIGCGLAFWKKESKLPLAQQLLNYDFAYEAAANLEMNALRNCAKKEKYSYYILKKEIAATISSTNF